MGQSEKRDYRRIDIPIIGGTMEESIECFDRLKPGLIEPIIVPYFELDEDENKQY